MKLLLAIDGSAQSEPCVQAAHTRPWPAASIIRVLNVLESSSSPGLAAAGLVTPAAYNQAHKTLQAEAEALVAAVAGRLRSAGLSVETAVQHGKTGHEIVDEARRWKADLILIGSHGRTGLKRVLMGSVAQYVVAHAPCSVEVVREPAW